MVGLYVTFDDGQPLISRSLAGTPLVRKLVARVQTLFQILFEYLNNIYPHVIFEDIVYNVSLQNNIKVNANCKKVVFQY